jgi:hypothetical protein
MDTRGNINIDSEIFVIFRLVDLAGLCFDSKACGIVAECCNEARPSQS